MNKAGQELRRIYDEADFGGSEFAPVRLKEAADEIDRLEAEIERLRALLHRMYDWASASNDWRPDARLGRDVRAELDGIHQQCVPTEEKDNV